ncbi:MAG: 2Fe-2S iron-sulfur cluster binding domain-containing protein [Gammaproteobacteria bacterium]|nr:2Fe-2S iron-sulfur cluster binding domain-containing protein [Gammaproteobacteria bacterium]NIM73995.1 2Fe-2S iron-sulfur cluster binding domain-containing protein [Gammaproteobacteria bacterium]NIN38876.1 2Fe-2S iron-sulfur cluster binding domain-containing protein [Gammaproteobacteria bacterium]NIO25771.1 2Fe-2S iron-sulfur cluster binding domain-containing protein [Gammaproteobacteria bacterium]NIO66401.1 2Fe-2S iron-sulfur cluster binding domain-containing protein [Gammaproteobacteria ba
MKDAKIIRLTVNGREREVGALPNETLLESLRGLGYFEVKSGCEKGDCGACAVLLDGEAVDSCLLLTWTVEGASITTVSGLGSVDEPHPLHKAFIDRGAAQCGYCTPGLIIAAKSMFDNDTREPSEDDMRLALSGNLCRCTGYTKVFDAIDEAARIMRERG